jgi:hypothetical protein
MGGGLFEVRPPTPAYRSCDFADPPHRFAGGGKTNKLVLAAHFAPESCRRQSMIRKSGNRFSDKIMLHKNVHRRF